MANIVFVHRGGESMASFRYRCQIPGEQLGKNHTVTLNGGDAHICIFSKPILADIEIAKAAKENGCRIVVDIGDDHFAHPMYGPIYNHMLNVAHYVICPTKNMRTRIREYTEKDIEVIPDPYEMERLEPHANGDKKLWFGHQVNLQDIKPYITDDLTIVTGPKLFEGTTLWTPENVSDAMLAANLVLLPTSPGHAYKSPNRLLNAVRMGLFCICDPHPAYEEFKDFVWTGGIPTGIRWAKHFQHELNARVVEAQDYVEKYSPEKVGQIWNNFIDSI